MTFFIIEAEQDICKDINLDKVCLNVGDLLFLMCMK